MTNPRTYYAIFCQGGHTWFNANPVGAEVMQFSTKADRADMLERINEAHAGTTACAAWAIPAKEAAHYVNMREFFDNSREEVCYTSNGWIRFHYRSQLITH